jgi:3-hydroxybutyryl-CoA dehydrogenase
MAASLDKNTRVGVLGAGAMGAGIAQVAAVAGHHVVVADTSDASIAKARKNLSADMARGVEKKRLSAEQAAAVEQRLTFAVAAPGDATAFRGCGVVIEAIVEDLKVKQAAFAAFESVVDADCILGTNTSSLAVSAIAEGRQHPERIIGLHFFNPATVLPLVEVVGASKSAPGVVSAAKSLIDSWGKVTVLAADTPGFIVNRVARPFYGESLLLLEQGVADVATIDWAMKEIGGFRMGPFELMDLIGNDVNYAVTKSVYEALNNDPRYQPSPIQRGLVESAKLGRKTGRGHYEYGNGVVPPAPNTDRALGQRIVDRVVAMLINEAADAVHTKIATRDDVDLAMTKGVNYPKGLLVWADELGVSTVLARMVALRAEFGGERYRPSPLLERLAKEGKMFYTT